MGNRNEILILRKYCLPFFPFPFFPFLFSMFLTIMMAQPSELRPCLPTHGVSRDDIFSVCGPEEHKQCKKVTMFFDILCNVVVR